jgi:pyruvate dehydrogenase E2 component (dihydrolipoamide acetyltransferase)
MPTSVQMPKLGMAMTEGTLLRWLSAEGDEVQSGAVIAEIETDKTVAPVEAPCGGRIGTPLVKPGLRVPVGTVLCQILAAGEAESGEPALVAADVAAGVAPRVAAATAVGTGAATVGARLTPLARRVAREMGLEPDQVAAAFPSGRVTRDELEAWAADLKGQRTAAPAPDATHVERRPLSLMRATVARRMTESLRESAQLTLISEVDVTALVRFRGQLTPDFEREFGFRPTYSDFLVKAMARAVPAVPQINARWAGDAVEVDPAIHIGVAVALDEGLIVPVIRDADRLSLAGIGRQVRDLSGRAREGRLLPGEASGSTISLTNLGTEGIDGFTPVLNPPEVAILGAGRIREVPAFAPDGQVRKRSVITLSLTIDHRVVDGAPGARYLRRVAELLGSPGLLLADN